jgi:hypothetical protein
MLNVMMNDTNAKNAKKVFVAFVALIVAFNL